MICAKCLKTIEYTPQEYGGCVVSEGKNLCKKDWTEYIELKNRQGKELNDWWINTRKA